MQRAATIDVLVNNFFMKYSHILLGGLLFFVGAGCTPPVAEPVVEEVQEIVVEDIAGVIVMEESQNDVSTVSKMKITSSPGDFALANGNVTYVNAEYGFSFTFPEGWTHIEWDDISVRLDLPGEGPNPYSEETGEGTNPMDDIVVSVYVIDDLAEYFRNDMMSDNPEDAKPLVIDGHKANAYNGIGIVNYFNYVVSLDGTQYIVVSGPADISERVAEIALSLTFVE